MTHEEVYRFLIDKAGWGVNEGSMFGEEGRGWMRMNVATQRSVIERAMEQLYAAWKTLRAEGKARLWVVGTVPVIGGVLGLRVL